MLQRISGIVQGDYKWKRNIGGREPSSLIHRMFNIYLMFLYFLRNIELKENLPNIL